MNTQPVIDLLKAQVVTLEGQKQTIQDQIDGFNNAITIITNSSSTTETTTIVSEAPAG